MKSIFQFVLICLTLSSCSFSNKKALKYYDSADTNAPYDVIIVPGVPHDGISWSRTMQARVLWGFHLYSEGLTKNIIYSGGAVYTKYSEAKIMAEYGKAMGIPASHIFTDTLAEHSSENVYYSYRLAKEQGFKKIAFATDPFQAKQLKGMIHKLELPIDLIPIVFDTLRTIDDLPEPSISTSIAIEDSFVSIKDRESRLTRLRGTMGKHIMFYEADLPNEKTIRKFRRRERLIEE